MTRAEPELNGSRELIDYLNGDGPFSQKLVLEIVQLKAAYGHIYEGLQTLSKQNGTRHAQIMGAIDGIRRKQTPATNFESWEDDTEDTDVTMDRDVLRRKAKGQHERALRMRRLAAWMAPPVAFLGALLWELLRSYGPLIPPRQHPPDTPAQIGPAR